MNAAAPLLPAPPVLPARTRIARRNAVTLKLLFIAGLVLVLQFPLHLVNLLRQERSQNRARAHSASTLEAGPHTSHVFEGYRMVERSLKHSVLVLTLVFAAFFLFETVARLRLHAVHYGLVGAALCLFYLTLLALGEFALPARAYVGAAVSSSLLITFYSAAVLHSRGRATVIGGLLAAVHGVLFVVLRMEHFALLAGTLALFAALAGVMFFTRDVDWHAQEHATVNEGMAP